MSKHQDTITFHTVRRSVRINLYGVPVGRVSRTPDGRYLARFTFAPLVVSAAVSGSSRKEAAAALMQHLSGIREELEMFTRDVRKDRVCFSYFAEETARDVLGALRRYEQSR